MTDVGVHVGTEDGRMIKARSPTTRITVGLTDDDYALLSDLERQTKAVSKASVIRDALRFYKAVLNGGDAGARLAINTALFMKRGKTR